MPHKFFVQLSTKQSGDTMRCNTNNLCHPKQILSTTRHKTERHITGLALPGCVTPAVVHLEAVLTLQTAFGGFLDSICGCDNGHSNVISSSAHHKADTPAPPWSLCVPWAAPAWHCSSHGARRRHLLLQCPGSAATRSCASEHQFFCGWSSIGWAGLTGQPHPYFCL